MRSMICPNDEFGLYKYNNDNINTVHGPKHVFFFTRTNIRSYTLKIIHIHTHRHTRTTCFSGTHMFVFTLSFSLFVLSF